MRFRTLLLASLAAAAMADGCSLIDPLDDISGGAPRTSKGARDSGALITAPADAAADDSSSAPAPAPTPAPTVDPPIGSCPGEPEPNFPTPRHLPFADTVFCGTVSTDDFDEFIIDVPQGASFTVSVDLPKDTEATVDFDGIGGNPIFVGSGSASRTDVKQAESLDVSLISTGSPENYTFTLTTF